MICTNQITKGQKMTESEIRQGMIYKDDINAILLQGDTLFLVDLIDGVQIELSRDIILKLQGISI